MKNFNENSFIAELTSNDIYDSINNENDANTKYEIFHDHFLKTLEKYAPLKKKSKKEQRNKHNLG